MSVNPAKVACAVCYRFEPQAWRKTLCKNCFHTLEEHGSGSVKLSDTVATFDVSISYDSDISGISTTDDDQQNVVSIDLDTPDVTKTNTSGDVIDVVFSGEIANTSRALDVTMDTDCNVTETVSISLPHEKQQSEPEVSKKIGAVSSVVKSKQSALLNAKSRGISKFGNIGNKTETNGGTTKRIWTKPSEARETTNIGKTPDSEISKVPRFGKLSASADKKEILTSVQVKLDTDRKDADSKGDRNTKLGLKLKTTSISSEEDESTTHSTDKKPPKDSLSKFAVKSNNGKKIDNSQKVRRNSNSSNVTNSEETPERKLGTTKQKSVSSSGNNKFKPSTPPLSRASSRDTKSAKESIKLNSDAAEIAELKNHIVEMANRCEKLEKEKLEMSDSITEKEKIGKSDIALIESLKKKVALFDKTRLELETSKEDLKKAKENEKEFRQVILKKERELQRLQKLNEDNKNDIDKVRDENADLQLEIRETRQEMEEMYDQFRETEIEEFRDLQKELELMAKNCRLLQFKLRKSERKGDKAESDRQQFEYKIKELQSIFDEKDAKAYIRTLEGDLTRAKNETVHVQDEYDISEDKRMRVEDENRKLQEIFEKTDKKQFRMEMEIDKLHDQIDELRRQLRGGADNSDDESSPRKILDANQIWRM